VAPVEIDEVSLYLGIWLGLRLSSSSRGEKIEREVLERLEIALRDLLGLHYPEKQLHRKGVEVADATDTSRMKNSAPN